MKTSIPPYSEEMEKSVLCVMINHSDHAEDVVRRQLPLDAFYIPAHRTIAEAVLFLSQNRKPVNFRTVCDRLQHLSELENCGGKLFINDLVDFVPGAAGLDHYVSVVRNKWMIRRSQDFAKDILNKCSSSQAEWSDIKLDLETQLMSLSKDGEKEEKSLKDLTFDWIDSLEKRLNKIQNRGFYLGIPQADKILGPSIPGELVIMASESSGGKTALAMQGALASANKGLPVAVFNLEMMNEQLWDRMFSNLAGVSMRKWRYPAFTESEYRRINQAASPFVNLPLHIIQHRRLDLVALGSKCRRLKKSYDIGAVIVDYLQRVKTGRKSKDNRYLEVAEVSDELKQLALELESVVVAPCQLNKEGKERESSDIRFDADRYFVIKENSLWVEKDRQGRRHYDIPIIFDAEYMIFRDGPQPEEESRNGNGRHNGRRPRFADHDQ